MRKEISFLHKKIKKTKIKLKEIKPLKHLNLSLKYIKMIQKTFLNSFNNWMKVMSLKLQTLKINKLKKDLIS